jgi:hypothetical protein
MPNFPTLRCSVCAFACVALPVYAAEWTTSASVTPAITYTDNVCLSKNNKKQEWIGLVTPAVQVTAEGSQANLYLDGAVEFNTLSDSKLENLGCNAQGFGNRSQIAPSLRAAADAVLVEQWLYLDGNAFIDQNEVTPFASGGGDSINRTGNTNTTYNYKLSPYLSHRFKDLASVNLRYTWDEQNNTEKIVRDSTEHSALALIENVAGTSRVLWGVQGDYSKVSYSDTPNQVANQDSELKSAQLNVGYQLSRVWQVNGFYGREWNDFVSSQDDIDGTYWDTGLRWTPNLRTTVDVGIGDRFFGSTPRFSITHRHKRSAFSADYAKTLTYNRNIRTQTDTPPLDPGFGPPPGVNPGQTTLGTSPILDERFTLGYVFLGRRTDFRLSAFQSDQTQQGPTSDLSFAESKFAGIAASSERSLSRTTSVFVGLDWNEQEPKRNDRTSIANKAETWSGTVRANHEINQNVNLSLTYQYTDRQSNSAFNEYTENQFTLDLRIDL